MAITLADVDALDRAIADGRGARTMTISDQSVTFNSLTEMHAHRAWMLAIIADAAVAATGTSRTRLAGMSKGV